MQEILSKILLKLVLVENSRNSDSTHPTVNTFSNSCPVCSHGKQFLHSPCISRWKWCQSFSTVAAERVQN